MSEPRKADVLHAYWPVPCRHGSESHSPCSNEIAFKAVSYPHDYKGFRQLVEIDVFAADALLVNMGWPERQYDTVNETRRTSSFLNKLAVMIPATTYGEDSPMFIYRHDWKWWLCIWED